MKISVFLRRFRFLMQSLLKICLFIKNLLRIYLFIKKIIIKNNKTTIFKNNNLIIITYIYIKYNVVNFKNMHNYNKYVIERIFN